MSLTVWRIVKRRHVTGAFSGEGARLYGGRWNLKETAVVYTAASISLAALEILVHIRDPDRAVDYVLIPAEVPAGIVETVDESSLPPGWASESVLEPVQRFGSDWAASLRSCVLRVPSAVVPLEWNYLINPAHPRFPDVRIGSPLSFRFDPRLFKS